MRNKLNKWIGKLSLAQKAITMIVVAVSLFLITYPIAKRASNIIGRNIHERTSLMQDPFYFERTWYIWIVYIVLVGGIAFLLFQKSSEK